MANLFPTPFPADLPENWTQGQIVSPNGTEVGLTQQYGYNYLMQLVNSLASGLNGVDANTLLTALGTISVANGGTGASTADTARENLNAFRKIPYYVPGSVEYDVDTAIFDSIIISLEKVPDLYNVIGGTAAYIWQFFYQTEDITSTRMQIAHGYSTNKMATRIYYQGAWSSWEEILTGTNEAIQAEMLLSQQDIIIKQNEHDEVLAAILLEQQTV